VRCNSVRIELVASRDSISASIPANERVLATHKKKRWRETGPKPVSLAGKSTLVERTQDHKTFGHPVGNHEHVDASKHF
jgi:hypothetical protein